MDYIGLVCLIAAFVDIVILGWYMVEVVCDATAYSECGDYPTSEF